MLSIFIMYSPDRADALSHTLACLEDMDLYAGCQKTLVVDGKADRVPPGWEAVQVPRRDGRFCWGRMWDAGVGSARHDGVVYLDADRLWPRDFLRRAADGLRDGLFVFTSQHVLLLEVLPLPLCRQLLALRSDELLARPEVVGRVRFEVRAAEPFHGPGKNVMSGGVAFTRGTYYRLGGVDHWYCGHGAYADSDFHMTAAVAGCTFVDLGTPELHYPHGKRGRDGLALSRQDLERLSLDNFIYYCHKWGLPRNHAERMAAACGIKRPQTYVAKQLAALTAAATGSD